MGLLTILKKMKQKEREVRLLMLYPVLGSGQGLCFGGRERWGAAGFKLNMWDVGGQKSLRSYWRNYFESTDGLIWVVDSADRARLQDCAQELAGLLLEERLAGATLLVFANKQDLPGALSKDAIREALELDNIKTHHWCIQGCSAVTGENLLLGIDWLLDDISCRIFTAD
ncbi:ADP-ribosylation factor-like protein 2 isoform X2 [Dendrobates tinctorius]|uniref:ADP-ribosylation factor-like protein 2 isoform X2 n=1 Tax=Dendrobates tinctorius TaxID=92724 RepID=UPI003CC97C0D